MGHNTCTNKTCVGGDTFSPKRKITHRVRSMYQSAFPTAQHVRAVVRVLFFTLLFSTLKRE